MFESLIIEIPVGDKRLLTAHNHRLLTGIKIQLIRQIRWLAFRGIANLQASLYKVDAITSVRQSSQFGNLLS